MGYLFIFASIRTKYRTMQGIIPKGTRGLVATTSILGIYRHTYLNPSRPSRVREDINISFLGFTVAPKGR